MYLLESAVMSGIDPLNGRAPMGNTRLSNICQPTCSLELACNKNFSFTGLTLREPKREL